MNFDLNLSDDQRQIVDTACALLAEAFPLGRLRKNAPDDLASLAAFGAFALSVPEALGGAGLTVVEEALVHTLFGRHLVSTRALSTAVAVAVARQAGQPDLAAEIAALERPTCAAVRSGAGVLLLDRGAADTAVLFEERGLSLVAIDNAEPLEGLGHSIATARMPARPGAVAATDDARVLAFADLLVSAQLLGVAEGARDLAIAYAGLRQQFGRPIGAFQAVKHHAADMAIAAEMLAAQCDLSAIALADGRNDAMFQISALRRLAPRVALANARACIQVHGGIGFSAEADAHHFVKHAHALARLGATPELLDLSAPMAPHRPVQERN